MQSPDTPAAPDEQALWRVEAARYALLRRLAFAMRHHMVVHLQPIGMITEVMDRRLKAAAPDLAQVRESMEKINGFSRAAVQSCLEVVGWLAPEPGATVPLDEGVRECLALVRSNFNFRGFSIRDDIQDLPFAVARDGLRNVLPACLLALTDHTASPGAVVVSAEMAGGRALLTLQLVPDDSLRAFPADEPYRLMSWAEVEAVAQADGVALERDDGRIRLTLASAA
ncbi:MAG: hypothetical protein HYX47_01870 [Burkholderiales bacterium]|nr:hypothetical protein [Burkholderiales bacterium]